MTNRGIYIIIHREMKRSEEVLTSACSSGAMPFSFVRSCCSFCWTISMICYYVLELNCYDFQESCLLLLQVTIATCGLCTLVFTNQNMQMDSQFFFHQVYRVNLPWSIWVPGRYSKFRIQFLFTYEFFFLIRYSFSLSICYCDKQCDKKHSNINARMSPPACSNLHLLQLWTHM